MYDRCGGSIAPARLWLQHFFPLSGGAPRGRAPGCPEPPVGVFKRDWTSRNKPRVRIIVGAVISKLTLACWRVDGATEQEMEPEHSRSAARTSMIHNKVGLTSASVQQIEAIPSNATLSGRQGCLASKTCLGGVPQVTFARCIYGLTKSSTTESRAVPSPLEDASTVAETAAMNRARRSSNVRLLNSIRSCRERAATWRVSEEQPTRSKTQKYNSVRHEPKRRQCDSTKTTESDQPGDKEIWSKQLVNIIVPRGPWCTEHNTQSTRHVNNSFTGEARGPVQTTQPELQTHCSRRRSSRPAPLFPPPLRVTDVAGLKCCSTRVPSGKVFKDENPSSQKFQEGFKHSEGKNQARGGGEWTPRAAGLLGHQPTVEYHQNSKTKTLPHKSRPSSMAVVIFNPRHPPRGYTRRRQLSRPTHRSVGRIGKARKLREHGHELRRLFHALRLHALVLRGLIPSHRIRARALFPVDDLPIRRLVATLGSRF